MYYYIVYGSVTYANRIKRFFDNEKGFVGVLHTPSSISTGGCSYSVKLDRVKAKRAIELSREYNIKIRGIYKQNADGTFIKVEIL